MTQFALPAVAAPRAAPNLAPVGRVAAAAILAIFGLVIASVGFALPIVSGMVASGQVHAPAGEAAAFSSVAAYAIGVVMFGVFLVAGAAGALDERRHGPTVGIVAAAALLTVAVGAQIGAVMGILPLDASGRVVVAAVSLLAGVAVAGLLAARRSS